MTPEPRQAPLPRNVTARPTIGFLTAWITDGYVTEAWSGVMDAVRRRNANVVNLVTARLQTPLSSERPGRVTLDLIAPDRIDGLVVCSEILYHFVDRAEVTRALERYQAQPIVSLGLLDGIPSVLSDIQEGVRRMVGHLAVAHGYRRLAFVRGPAGEETAEAEYRGFLAGLAEHALVYDPELVTPPGVGWGSEVGLNGVRVLMDERCKTPGRDFDGIVGCGDYEILGALEELRQRGFRVPQDVALTGFNNLQVARFLTPSLTTVDRRTSQMAAQAADMVLDLIEGRPVPELVVVVPELRIRRSCGCLSHAITQISYGARRASKAPPDPGRAALVEAVRQAGKQATADSGALLDSAWADRLVDACLADVSSGGSLQFLSVLEDILRQVALAGSDVSAWHKVLSTLRYYALAQLGDDGMVAHAEDLWQQARFLIGDSAERAQGWEKLTAAENMRTLTHITQSLIETSDVGALMDVLARDLPQLGIPGCYLSLYEQPMLPGGSARLLLAYDDRGRVALEPGGRRFPIRQLVPSDLLPSTRSYNLVVLPLYFQEEQLGIIVLEMGPRDGKVYDALRTQVSAALKGALLTARNAELYVQAVAARQVAEEADRLKSRFLSTVSHELRTPLSLIVGTIEMLLRDGRQSGSTIPYHRDLLSIRASAQHLARLISDVLDLASSQAGELRLAGGPLRLRDVLDQVATLGEAMAREKGLSWESDIPADLPAVWGDRTRLQQVVLNLVSNAIKFTEQGYVHLWAEVGKRQVVVAVTDSGMGIPPAEQQFVFNEFRQSERAARRGYGGIGLGLAISKRLVELHGGTIGVLSTGTDGAGSTFYFTLATLPEVPDAATAKDEAAGTVIVLTEQMGASERLVQHLAVRGFRVEVLAVEGQPDWLGRISAGRPGAIVLACEPSAERGWELMQVLRHNEATQDIPVVFYTLSEEQDHGATLTLDFLSKPLAEPELAQALARQGLDAGRCDRSQGILIVDDEPGILDLHARLLQELVPKCRIYKAHNGQDALEQMSRQRPDLVLLDLMMPVLDGFGVLDAMRERESTRNVPVIVMTAQVLTSRDMARLQQGVAAVLSKGLFTAAEVLAQVTETLSHNRRLGSEAQRIVRQAMGYIHEHYSESFTREALARAVGLSDRYLTQCFREETGITPIGYLNRYRIKQARGLLEGGDMMITDVALATGFSDPSYFARVFRDEAGVTPRAYQRGERGPTTAELVSGMIA